MAGSPKRRRRRPGRPRQRPLGPSPLFDHSCCVQDAAARSCQDHGGGSPGTAGARRRSGERRHQAATAFHAVDGISDTVRTPGFLAAVRSCFCGPDFAHHRRGRCRLQALTDLVIQRPCAGEAEAGSLLACSRLLVAGQGSRRWLPDTCLLRCRSRSASACLVLPPRRRRELWSPLATDGVDPSRFVKFLWLLCTRVSCCCRDRCTDAATGHPDETTGGEQKPRGRAVLASNVPWQLPVQVQPGSIGELCL